MPDRRVNVTLTIPTAEDTSDVLYSVLAAVRDESGLQVENASVHAFDLDDNTEKEAPHNPVHLVVDPASGVVQGFADDRRAHEYARNVGAVVVELPITSDYRGERGGA